MVLVDYEVNNQLVSLAIDVVHFALTSLGLFLRFKSQKSVVEGLLSDTIGEGLSFKECVASMLEELKQVKLVEVGREVADIE